ncbi:hypothetical protein SASPL_142818 [Salvia splendens]|uniref:GCF C-terminal domain-containing protein n=1 Tax=Salvia splendens TaxID=180675 RepID=A0A8X8WM63_SALSN|nr:hypothetical protein SASPL_142818 [Salvia splendens]
MDITRRSEARKRRRVKADSKRKLAMERDSSVQLIEGEFSTDESDSETSAHESTHNQLLQVAAKIFSDAAEEYSQFQVVVGKFEKWKKDYATSYRDAYMCSLLFNYGLPEDENGKNGEDADDDDANLIPEPVAKVALPILHHQVAFCWDILSTRETKNVISAMDMVTEFVGSSNSAVGKLVAVLRDRFTTAVNDLVVMFLNFINLAFLCINVPYQYFLNGVFSNRSPHGAKAVPDAARVAAYRFGTSVRLLRNISLWSKVLAISVVEKIALDELLYGNILPHLRSIQTNVHEAVIRTERVIASLNDVWTGSSVTEDRSKKLQPLVDYVLLLGKTMERKHASGGMENEMGKLVSRLRKMLVELNQYDHARALSRSFNLKEAI